MQVGYCDKTVVVSLLFDNGFKVLLNLNATLTIDEFDFFKVFIIIGFK